MDLYKYISRGWTHNSEIKKVNVTETRESKCICCDEIIIDEAYQLPCGHLYHKECWRDVIDFKKKCNYILKCEACEYSNKSWKLLC